jgi:hypothetical protein
MTRSTNTRAIASWPPIQSFYVRRDIRVLAVSTGSCSGPVGKDFAVRRPPCSCGAVEPIVNGPVRFPFLAPRPPFRGASHEQHQDRAGPQNSHREYQCDRFLGAHTVILCLGTWESASS